METKSRFRTILLAFRVGWGGSGDRRKKFAPTSLSCKWAWFKQIRKNSIMDHSASLHPFREQSFILTLTSAVKHILARLLTLLLFFFSFGNHAMSKYHPIFHFTDEEDKAFPNGMLSHSFCPGHQKLSLQNSLHCLLRDGPNYCSIF